MLEKHRFLEYKPSQIAAASILNAVDMSKHNEPAPLRATHGLQFSNRSEVEVDDSLRLWTRDIERVTKLSMQEDI